MNAFRGPRRRRRIGSLLGMLGVAVALAVLVPAAAGADVDPRIGLSAGWLDAGSANSGMELLAHNDKPPGFFNPSNIGSISFANSDIAFSGKYAFAGSFHGFNIYDLSNPALPTHKTSVVCPGGQGDMSVWGNLLFMSVEETRGKIDCSAPPATAATRFRGVRIFDISNIAIPVQIAAVQTCRGSHTHTLVTSPSDKDNIYVYVSGTAGIRSAAELAGCSSGSSTRRSEHRELPHRRDQGAARRAADRGDRQQPAPVQQVRLERVRRRLRHQEQHPDPRYGIRGMLNWLNTSGPQPTYPAGDPRAPGGQSVSQSVVCHDITAFPEIGLAAGAARATES